MALGELKGIGRTMPNPYLLINPLQKKEAIASSNIEGTHTSLTDLFLLEAGAEEKDRPPDTREVYNYVRALQKSIESLRELPVCLRVIREAHGILLAGVQKNRGANIVPGEFKTDQNWIGGGTKIDQARFVPPPPRESIDCLSDLEKFINDRDVENAMPALVHIALAHYQFETIHPFPDGNGRVGRLLIPLMLCAKGILPQPLLYMSAFFEREREEYVDRLFAVSTQGDWTGWLVFFLGGVMEQCQETIAIVRKLQDLHASYRERLQKARASALISRLIDVVLESPFLTIPMAQKIIKVTYRSAQLNIDKLVAADILRELKGSNYPKWFYAHEVLDAIQG
jgi:Fic family protein